MCACLIMVAVVSLCTRCCNKKCHNEYEDEVVWAETRIMNNTYSSNRKCNESTNGNSDNSPLAKGNTCERNVSQTSTLDILPYNDDRTIITPITKDNSLNVRESPDIPHVTNLIPRFHHSNHIIEGTVTKPSKRLISKLTVLV